MLVVAVTGHRPPKGGLVHDGGRWDRMDPGNGVAWHRFRVWLEQAVEANGEVGVITGMALGWDTIVARVCNGLGVPYTAAIPFVGQEKRWPQAVQEKYHHLLDGAHKVVVVSEGGYSAQKMQVRNEWMVDHADVVAAYWDGSKGGTRNCIRYAKSKKVQVFNLYEPPTQQRWVIA